MTRTYMVADLFCGAGGSSSGARKAIHSLGGEMDLVAVNHWNIAIETHQRNHPTAAHYVEDVTAAKPREIVPDGYLDLLMASPECTHFSRARGGRPVNDQSRMNAWAINRWCTDLNVRCLLVENVPEFQEWGPVLEGGKPDPDRKGVFFQAWRKSLIELGYDVDFRVLNAADYGDATTRKRFFLIARNDGRPIRWPLQTHGPAGGGAMFGERRRWRAAREVIDWENPGRSLLDDPKYLARPLSIKTRQRIARGLLKFGGPLAEHYVRLLDLDTPAIEGDTTETSDAFLLPQRSTNPERSVDVPLPTSVTIARVGLVQHSLEPFVFANRNNNVPKDCEAPIPTLTSAHGGGIVVIDPSAEPFVLGQQSGSASRSAGQPLPTIATDGAISLTEPCITPYYGQSTAVSIDRPLPTVTARDRFGLVEPLAVPYGPDAEARPVTQPLPTIMTRDRLGVASFGLAAPFIVPNFGERDGQAPRVHSLEDPLPAVTSHGAGELVAPLIVEPVLRAIEAGDVDPRRVVLVDGVPHLLDIRFRMLTNPELARATGFDDDEARYEFAGTKTEITKQIGNAVPVNLSRALVGAILGDG